MAPGRSKAVTICSIAPSSTPVMAPGFPQKQGTVWGNVLRERCSDPYAKGQKITRQYQKWTGVQVVLWEGHWQDLAQKYPQVPHSTKYTAPLNANSDRGPKVRVHASWFCQGLVLRVHLCAALVCPMEAAPEIALTVLKSKHLVALAEMLRGEKCGKQGWDTSRKAVITGVQTRRGQASHAGCMSQCFQTVHKAGD